MISGVYPLSAVSIVDRNGGSVRRARRSSLDARARHAYCRPSGGRLMAQAMKTILLKGGRIIDPGSQVDGIRDLRLRDGRVDAIGTALAAAATDDVVDCAGDLVLPGLIDTHAHVYQHVTGRFGL